MWSRRDPFHMPLDTLTKADAVLDYCSGQLSRAVSDAKHPWHWPAVVSAGPAARIVVLRAYDAAAHTLRFYTDARSAKVTQLTSTGGLCEVLFYHSKHRTQLRLTAIAEVQADQQLRRQLWDAQSPAARRNYATELAPGTPLAHPGDGLRSEDTNGDLENAFDNFVIYHLTVREADFLQLGQQGQRRCKWAERWEPASLTWVTP